MRQVHIFRNIDELVTLKGAYKASGKGVSERHLSVVKNGAMISVGGEIKWVGSTKALSSALIKKYGTPKNAKEHSFKGLSILPAFVECHTHLIFAGSRSDEFELRNQGVSYSEIARRGGGILKTVKSTRKATLQELVSSGQERVNRFLQQGVGTVEVKSGYALNHSGEVKMLSAARMLKKARVLTTYLGPHAIPKEFSDSDDYLEEVINKTLPLVAKKKLADRVDIFIEKGYFSPEQAEAFFYAAKNYGLDCVAHTEQLNRTGGIKSCVQEKILSADHLVQANAQDIRALAKSDITSVLLPGADFYLQMDYPPARKLIDGGARVALATDFNPGSCPTQDLSLIGFLARQEMKMSLSECIAAYTVGAAHALGLGQKTGALVSGLSCDFSVLNGSWQDLFYQVGYHPIKETWVKGRRVFNSK